MRFNKSYSQWWHCKETSHNSSCMPAGHPACPPQSGSPWHGSGSGLWSQGPAHSPIVRSALVHRHAGFEKGHIKTDSQKGACFSLPSLPCTASQQSSLACLWYTSLKRRKQSESYMHFPSPWKATKRRRWCILVASYKYSICSENVTVTVIGINNPFISKVFVLHIRGDESISEQIQCNNLRSQRIVTPKKWVSFCRWI